MLVIAEHGPSLQTELKWKQVEVHFEPELIYDLSEYNNILYLSNIYIYRYTHVRCNLSLYKRLYSEPSSVQFVTELIHD